MGCNICSPVLSQENEIAMKMKFLTAGTVGGAAKNYTG
jgi:hypothetical protein